MTKNAPLILMRIGALSAFLILFLDLGLMMGCGGGGISARNDNSASNDTMASAFGTGSVQASSDLYTGTINTGFLSFPRKAQGELYEMTDALSQINQDELNNP